MHDLMIYDGIVSDVSMWDEGRLSRGDYFIKHNLKSRGQDFSGDFEYDIAKGNWPKLIHFRGSNDFRDKCNESVIELLKHMTMSEEILNSLNYRLTNNMPVCFVKIWVETIRSRTFMRCHAK